MDFKRYPHVGDIFSHYASSANKSDILALLKSDVSTKDEAYVFSRFVIFVIDEIAKDMGRGVSVMGSTDNTSMIPDIDYQVSLYLSDRGFEAVWDEVCDEG